MISNTEPTLFNDGNYSGNTSIPQPTYNTSSVPAMTLYPAYNPNGFPIRIWMLTCYTVIAIIGISGNWLVLHFIKSTRAIKMVPFGVYLSGLAFADLLVSLTCLPVYITSTSAFSHPRGLKGEVMCKLVTDYAIIFVFSTTSIYILTAIAYERYLAVCRPLTAYSMSSKNRARKVVVCIWVLALFLNLPTFLENHIKKSNINTDKISTMGAHCDYVPLFGFDHLSQIMYSLQFLLAFVAPLCTMTFCFVSIKNELNRQIAQLKAKEVKQPGELAWVAKRRKTISTVQIIALLFYICYTPNQLAWRLVRSNVIHWKWLNWNHNSYQWTVVLMFLSSSINPFVYAFRSSQFRNRYACYRRLTDKWDRSYSYTSLRRSPSITTIASNTTIGKSVSNSTMGSYGTNSTLTKSMSSSSQTAQKTVSSATINRLLFSRSLMKNSIPQSISSSNSATSSRSKSWSNSTIKKSMSSGSQTMQKSILPATIKTALLSTPLMKKSTTSYERI